MLEIWKWAFFLCVDYLYMGTKAGRWELPATDQAVGGAKVPERPVVVRWCRVEEDAAWQFCGQEWAT